MGRRRSGWILIALSAVAVSASAVVVFVMGVSELVARVTDPGTLRAVLVGNAVVAVLRLAPVLHAWAVGGGRNFLVGAALAALVVAPHVAVGYVGEQTNRTLDAVFSAPATTTTSTTTTPSTTTTSAASGSTETTIPTTTTTIQPPTTTTTAPPEDQRLNVLLLGGDAGPGRSGLRTDSVIVASIDRSTGDALLVSIPRNWGGLELADGSVIPDRIVNEVYEWARRQPERFPGVDPGAAALVEATEVLTGLDIDYFALVDLTGFAAVVDALGGVKIDVPRSVYGPSYDPATGGYTMILIPRGEQELSGAEALAYVRERYQSSDYDRMARQRCVLASLAAEADVVSLLRGIRGILAAMEDHVTTDVPREAVPMLIRTAADVEQISVVGLDNRWRRGWDSRGFAIPDPEQVRATVAEAIQNPDRDDDVLGLLDSEAACG